MRCRLLVAIAAAAVGGSITSGKAKPPAGVTDVDGLIELERAMRFRAVRECAVGVAWSLQTGRALRVDHADGGPPDFDGDGTVGISDFLELLANRDACLYTAPVTVRRR